MTKNAKFIPDLAVDVSIAESGSFLGIDGRLIPPTANEIAAILVENEMTLRTSLAVLSRVLGWLAFQAQDQIAPNETFEAVVRQSRNYCGAFSAWAER